MQRPESSADQHPSYCVGRFVTVKFQLVIVISFFFSTRVWNYSRFVSNENAGEIVERIELNLNPLPLLGACGHG